MKTLKVGALALSVMVAGSALAYPGQEILKAVADKYAGFIAALILKNYARTALVLSLPISRPKASAAVATVAVVGSVVAYKQYKNYKAKQARMARQLARQAKAEQTAEEVTLG